MLTGDHAAVRLALGESQIISDTKVYLENHGVKLDVFNQVCNSINLVPVVNVSLI